jgi:hypothetical protein
VEALVGPNPPQRGLRAPASGHAAALAAPAINARRFIWCPSSIFRVLAIQCSEFTSPACGERSTREARRVRGPLREPEPAEAPPHRAEFWFSFCAAWPSPRKRGEVRRKLGDRSKCERRRVDHYPGLNLLILHRGPYPRDRIGRRA